jgi:hypothetical protein
VRVSGRIGENLVNGSFCQFPGTLILFLRDLHPGSRVDVSSFSPVHLNSLSQLVEHPRRLTSAIRRATGRRLHGMVELSVFLKFQYQGSNDIRSCGLLALESFFLLRGAPLLLVLLPFCFLVLSLCHLFLTLVLILLAAFVSHRVPPLLLSVIFSP